MREKMRRLDPIHPSFIDVENAVISTQSFDNPWSGAYTKTFTGESKEMDSYRSSAINKPKYVLKKMLAEFTGDFIFVFIGCLSVLDQTNSKNNEVKIALAHGLTIFVLGHLFGSISGGHFNPAVTLCAVLTGRLKPVFLVPFLSAQILGGFFGALLVRVVSLKNQYFDALGGAPTVQNGFGTMWYQTLLFEAILTGTLCLVALASTLDDGSNSITSPLAAGMTIVSGSLVGTSLRGGIMNPARALGPCSAYTLFGLVEGLDINLISSIWKWQYIYLCGPLAGSIIGALIFRLITSDSK